MSSDRGEMCIQSRARPRALLRAGRTGLQKVPGPTFFDHERHPAAALGTPGFSQPRGTAADTRDPQLFFIHSLWTDEAAFDRHAGLPHTVRFLATVQSLVDHPLDVRRARAIA